MIVSLFISYQEVNEIGAWLDTENYQTGWGYYGARLTIYRIVIKLHLVNLVYLTLFFVVELLPLLRPLQPQHTSKSS